MARANADGTFEDALARKRDGGIRPGSIERATLNTALLDECNISIEEAVVAGLAPEAALETDPTTIAFCSAWRSRVEPAPRMDDSSLSAIESGVIYYQELAEQDAGIPAPAAIEDELSRWVEHLAMKAYLLEEKQLTETQLDQDEDFRVFRQEIDHDQAKGAIFEYVRINC